MSKVVLPVTELRQWAYCPRVAFYHQCLPGAGTETFKMTAGAKAQHAIELLETRRTLARYGWEGAKRVFGLWLSNQSLGLSGKLDLLLQRGSDAAIVDFKLTSGPARENHWLQLAGYALLVQAEMSLSVRTGFVYRISDDALFFREIEESLLQQARECVEKIRMSVCRQILPEPTPIRQRCAECEYANYCGDIW